MSTCTRQQAQCQDSTITLTRYQTEIFTSEGRPLLAYLLLRGRPPAARLPTPEGAPARYLLLRGRPPAARLPTPEGAPARYLLLRGRPPSARLLAPEGAKGKGV